MAEAVRSKLFLTVGALLALAAAAPALAGNGGFAPVPPESPNAEGITQTWWIITAFMLGHLRARRGPPDHVRDPLPPAATRPRDADGAQVHGSNRLETMWTIGPVVILFVIAIVVFVKLPGISNVPAGERGREEPRRRGGGPPVLLAVPLPERRRLDQHPPRAARPHRGAAGHRSRLGRDPLVVGAGARGQDRRDPGRVNSLWFQAEKVGAFQGQCAELCGLNHARMLTTVEVLPAAEFDRWLATRREEQTAGTSTLGEEQWNGACAGCHGLDGQGGVGRERTRSRRIAARRRPGRRSTACSRTGRGRCRPSDGTGRTSS